MKRKPSLLLGLALGSAFGLLFAPKKGSQFRKELKDDIKKGGDGSKVLKSTAKEIGVDLKDTAKEISQEPAVKNQINKGKRHFKKVAQNVKGEILKKADELKSKARSGLKKNKSGK